jgi:hypothetical protein
MALRVVAAHPLAANEWTPGAVSHPASFAGFETLPVYHARQALLGAVVAYVRA